MSELTLYTIEQELSELLEFREQAESDPDEIAAIDKQIAEYMSREVRKVDGVCHAIHAYENAANAARIEAQRISDRAKTLESAAKRIKERALEAMQAHGVTKLETPTNRLRVQANGGKEALDVLVSELPEQYQHVVVKMPVRIWRGIQKDLTEVDLREVRGMSIDADQDALREALKQRVPCPECVAAVGLNRDGLPELQRVDCPRCEGKGTIPNTVPGARLLRRGVHLRVE